MAAKRTPWVVGGLTIVVAIGAGVIGWKHTRAEDEKADGSSVRRAARVEWSLTSGVYDLDASAAVLGQRGQAFQVSLSGPVEVIGLGTVDGVEVERWKFSGQVSSETLDVHETTQLGEALSRPFFVERQAGHVQRLRFSAETGRTAQTTWRSLVGFVQFEAGAPPSWQSSESDAIGDYLAEYVVRDQGIEKTKLRFTGTHADGVQVQLLSSSVHFEDQGGRVSLSGREQTESSSALLPTPLRSVLELRLTFERATRSATGEDLAAYRGGEVLSWQAAGTPSSLAGELDRNMARGFSWDTAVATLTEPGAKGYARAYQALVASIRLDEAVLERTAEASVTNATLRSALLAALGDAGTPRAQDTLRRLANDSRFSSADRLVMARGLSRVASPTAETTAFLRQNTSDPAIGSQAKLGLGSNARRLAGSDPAAANALVDDLGQRLASDPGPGKADYLGALGNSGQSRALSHLQPYLGSSDTKLAAQATFSLRHIADPSVDLLLAQQLDPSRPVEVRANALRALHDRQPTPPLPEQVAALMLHEPEERVRGPSVDLAIAWAPRVSSLRSVLLKVAQNDPSEQVRKLADAGLRNLQQ